MGLSDREKNLKLRSAVLVQITRVADSQTYGRTELIWRIIYRAQHIAARGNKTEQNWTNPLNPRLHSRPIIGSRVRLQGKIQVLAVFCRSDALPVAQPTASQSTESGKDFFSTENKHHESAVNVLITAIKTPLTHFPRCTRTVKQKRSTIDHVRANGENA